MAATLQPFEIIGLSRKTAAYLGSGIVGFSNPARSYISRLSLFPLFLLSNQLIFAWAHLNLERCCCKQQVYKSQNTATLWLFVTTSPGHSHGNQISDLVFTKHTHTKSSSGKRCLLWDSYSNSYTSIYLRISVYSYFKIITNT